MCVYFYMYRYRVELGRSVCVCVCAFCLCRLDIYNDIFVSQNQTLVFASLRGSLIGRMVM